MNERKPQPNTSVLFVGAPEVPPMSIPGVLHIKKASAETDDVEVRVLTPYRVCHQGNAYTGGDSVTVPTAVADKWIQSKWVEPVSKRKKA